MEAVAHFLRARLEQAWRLLSGPGAPDDKAVHLARKRLKDARAALRLLRPVLGEACSAREEAALRRAARRLSALRDARVVADLLARMRVPGRPALRPPPSPLQNPRRSGAEIAACRRRLACALHRELAPKEAREGLKHSYRQARRRLRAARRSATGADRHALRKSVRRLRAQLRLLQPDSKLTRGLGHLARLLGGERDLSLLLRSLSRRQTQPLWVSDAAARAQLRRALLARRALAQARLLLAASTRDFVRDLGL
ncbi:MAG: hypothetical protein A2X37_05555 [Elusimicrobia bacterium GWA2_66_18]|nr:MAG: hypothetical protein A2X37_05555 [Elusimicrobia bacterium GWA2_66_18]